MLAVVPWECTISSNVLWAPDALYLAVSSRGTPPEGGLGELQGAQHCTLPPSRLGHGQPSSHLRRMGRSAFHRPLRVARDPGPRFGVPAREALRTLQHVAGVHQPAGDARSTYMSVAVPRVPVRVVEIPITVGMGCCSTPPPSAFHNLAANKLVCDLAYTQRQ